MLIKVSIHPWSHQWQLSTAAQTNTHAHTHTCTHTHTNTHAHTHTNTHTHTHHTHTCTHTHTNTHAHTPHKHTHTHHTNTHAHTLLSRNIRTYYILHNNASTSYYQSVEMLLVLLCESVECVGELFCETAAMLLIQDQCGPALGGRGCVWGDSQVHTGCIACHKQLQLPIQWEGKRMQHAKWHDTAEFPLHQNHIAHSLALAVSNMMLATGGFITVVLVCLSTAVATACWFRWRTHQPAFSDSFWASSSLYCTTWTDRDTIFYLYGHYPTH